MTVNDLYNIPNPYYFAIDRANITLVKTIRYFVENFLYSQTYIKYEMKTSFKKLSL